MMCQACEGGETVYLPCFGRPGGWRPSAAEPPPAGAAPTQGEGRPRAVPPGFAGDGSPSE